MKKWIKVWLDAIFLVLGLVNICIGAFLVNMAVGFVVTGCSFAAMAFFVAKKSAG